MPHALESPQFRAALAEDASGFPGAEVQQRVGTAGVAGADSVAKEQRRPVAAQGPSRLCGSDPPDQARGSGSLRRRPRQARRMGAFGTAPP